MRVKGGTLGFSIILHKGGALVHRLEVGPFPFGFIFPSISGPFLRSDEELGRPREALYIKKRLWTLPVLYSISRETVTTPLGLMSPLMPLTYILSPLSRGLYYV